MTTAIAEANGLRYAVQGTYLITDVSLALMPGRFTAVVGPNGAGKSTLVRLLSGEIAPQSGTIAYDGVPLGRWPAWRLAAKRAVLPQSAQIAFPFTVAEIARLGADGIGRGLSAAARDALVTQALTDADIAYLRDRDVTTLSGGERQRAHLARVRCQLTAGATVEERQVLFLDEPVAGLDLKHQVALLDQARALAEGGRAVLAVLHDLTLAAAYADELLVMAQGRIAEAGAPADVLTRDLLRTVFGVELGPALERLPELPFRLAEKQA